MFKSVATKLAHNTTVPSLGGNKDLKGLQDMITAEKTVLSSSQKFALDLAKSAESLKQWGTGEGDDLGDISNAATTLILHLAGAINHFSNIESTIREQMKALRKREETLDEMRRRRRTLASRAEDAEKKLSRMNPDNKNLQSQTALLAQLRDDIRTIDAEIMNEEAGIGDFKRHSIKNWLGHKFGGIQDFCEKGLIISDLGKQLLAVVPLEQTQPGLPRPYYVGHARTEAIIFEAQNEVQEVVFSAEPGTGKRAGGGSSQPGQPGGYPTQPQPIGQSAAPPGNRPLSGQLSPAQLYAAQTTFSGYSTITAGDRPGETLMRADTVNSTNYQNPQTPQSQYAQPQGPPQGYTGSAEASSPAQHSPTYPTRASFVSLPQIQSQPAGSDLGMTSYLSPMAEATALPPVPEQQQGQAQQYGSEQYQQQPGYPQQLQQPPQQSPYQQPQPQPPYQQQQYPQQTPYPDPQQYPPPQPNQPHQSMPQGGNYAAYTYPQAPGSQPQEVNEFGTYNSSDSYAARSSSLRHARMGADGSASPAPAEGNSGRFATFPVKAGGPRPQLPAGVSAPYTNGGAPPIDERVPSLEVDRQGDSFLSSVASALGPQWQQDRNSQITQGAAPPETQQQPYHGVEQSQAATAGHGPHDSPGVPPPPSYDTALPLDEYDDPAEGVGMALAYMSDHEADAAGSEGSHDESKIVRFGSVRDVDDEMAKRHSHQAEGQSTIPPINPAHYDETALSNEESPVDNTPTNAPHSPPVVIPHRAPTPSEEGHGDAALNAAAAREVSRELDSLMFSSVQQPQPPALAPEVRASSPPQPPHQPAPQPMYQQQPSYQMYRQQSPPTSPTYGAREPQYVREKDRAASGVPSRQSTPISPANTDNNAGGHSPLVPPPNLSSPIGSTASFRTPPEYPTPTSTGQLYGLGAAATGSATSFIPGANPRTISAAAFKRQVRQPTGPSSVSSIDTNALADNTSPLHVRKRLPASPYPVQGGDMQRVPSAPLPGGNLQDPGMDERHRSVSTGYAQPPQQQYQQQPGPGDYYSHGQQNRQSHAGEESYDYLSAYMSEDGHGGHEDNGQQQGGLRS